MDWLCKALGLPYFFLHHHPDSRGGGVLQVCTNVQVLFISFLLLNWESFVPLTQSTVSESTLVALLAARKDKILQLRAELDQDVDDSVLNSRLVAYASDQVGVTTSCSTASWKSKLRVDLKCLLQAHSSVEKAGLISLVKIRFLPADDQLSLRGDALKQAIQEDRRRGLVPFMVSNLHFLFNTGRNEAGDGSLYEIHENKIL